MVLEADFQRFYNLDLADVPLDRTWRLLNGLPPESRTFSAITGRPYWSIEAHLLDDLRMVQTGTKKKPAKPHPDRPLKPAVAHDPKRRQAHLRRIAKRRRDIEAGRIT